MICKNPDCQHEIPDEAIFCPDCGWKQSDTPDPAPQQNEESKKTDEGNKRNDSDKKDNKGNEPYQSNDICIDEETGTFVKDGVKYFPIKSLGKNNKLLKWEHDGDCKGNLYLGDDATCICAACGAEAKITHWGIKETNSGIFARICKDKEPSLSTNNAMEIVGGITSLAGLEWLTKFTDSLIRLQNPT